MFEEDSCILEDKFAHDLLGWDANPPFVEYHDHALNASLKVGGVQQWTLLQKGTCIWPEVLWPIVQV